MQLASNQSSLAVILSLIILIQQNVLIKGVLVPLPNRPSSEDSQVFSISDSQTQPPTFAPRFGNALDERNCGFSENVYNRMIPGEAAKLGAHPWIAAIGYRSEKNSEIVRWRCAGTMVSSRFVLTAGHCVDNQTDLLWKVRLGEHNINSDNDGATPIDVLIMKAILHPKYNNFNYVNDIALLKLAQVVGYSVDVHPICLPTSQTRSEDYISTQPIIAGWGTSLSDGPFDKVLRHAPMIAVSNEDCANLYASYKTQVIDDRVLCATWITEDHATCMGGGPLLNYLVDGRFSVIGVVSFGVKCGEGGFPEVYTRVSSYLDWIKKVMRH